MKRIVRMLSLMILCTIIFGTTCFANEKTKFMPPTEIQVEGGQLKLIAIEEEERGIQPRYVYKVCTDGGNLNVRSGPGTNYSIVGQIANGSYVDVSFMQDASIAPWVYGSGTSITGKEISGYMHGDYIAPSGL